VADPQEIPPIDATLVMGREPVFSIFFTKRGSFSEDGRIRGFLRLDEHLVFVEDEPFPSIYGAVSIG
jgi:hypothetical protein